LLPNLATLGSLSKTYWPGLRVGWIRASIGMIAALAAAKAAADLGSAAYPQAIAAALITSRHSEILGWRADQFRARRDALQVALHTHLPDWSWKPPRGGLALWVRLSGQASAGLDNGGPGNASPGNASPGNAGAGNAGAGNAGAGNDGAGNGGQVVAGRANAAAFAQAALRHGVAVVPGRLLSATNSDHGSVRIAFTQPPEQLRRAAPALARAWQSTPSRPA